MVSRFLLWCNGAYDHIILRSYVFSCYGTNATCVTLALHIQQLLVLTKLAQHQVPTCPHHPRALIRRHLQMVLVQDLRCRRPRFRLMPIHTTIRARNVWCPLISTVVK